MSFPTLISNWSLLVERSIYFVCVCVRVSIMHLGILLNSFKSHSLSVHLLECSVEIIILSTNNHSADPSFSMLAPLTSFPHLIALAATSRKMLNSSRVGGTHLFYKQRNKALSLSKVIQWIRAEARLDSKVYELLFLLFFLTSFVLG